MGLATEISILIVLVVLAVLLAARRWSIGRRFRQDISESIHQLSTAVHKQGRLLDEIRSTSRSDQAAADLALQTLHHNVTEQGSVLGGQVAALSRQVTTLGGPLAELREQVAVLRAQVTAALDEQAGHVKELAAKIEADQKANESALQVVQRQLTQWSERFGQITDETSQNAHRIEEMKLMVDAASRALLAVEHEVSEHGKALEERVAAEVRRLLPPELPEPDNISLEALRDLAPELADGAAKPESSTEFESALLNLAQKLVYVRPLVPYPGWRFDSDWSNTDLSFRMRRYIWTYFRERNLEVPFTMTWHENLALWLHLGNDSSRLVFVAGCMEPNEFAYLSRVLSQGMTFVDAGANDGLYTLFAAKRVGAAGRVLSFEPSQREFDRLKENIEQNRIENVRAFQVALAEKDGTAELKIADGSHHGQNTLGDFMHPVNLLRTEPVILRTLDGILKEQGVDRVDVMKLDVEGAEMRVLEGAGTVLRDLRPTILFEVSDSGLRFQGSCAEQLFDFLRSLEYVLYAFDAVTGKPARAQLRASSDNMLAIPAEKEGMS